MKKLQNFLVISFIIVSLFTFSGCHKEGFSLARSDQTYAMSDCVALIKKKKHDRAVKCFEAYKSRHYGQKEAALADLAIADAYFLKKDYLGAAEYYQIFIDSNPFHEKIPYAYYKAGVSLLKETPKTVDRDQQYLEKSVRYLETVIQFYGNTPYAKLALPYYQEAKLNQAKKHYYVGRFYYRTKEYLAAIPRFQTVVTDFPKVEIHEISFYYLISSLTKIKQKELASKYFEIFKQNYPNSKYVKRISL